MKAQIFNLSAKEFFLNENLSNQFTLLHILVNITI